MSGVGKRILLGHVVGAHGIRGDVLINCYTAEAAAIADYGALSDEGGVRTFSLRVLHQTSKGVVAHIEGIADRTAAEQLKGVGLYVAREHLPDAGGGAFYHVDLIGLGAVDAHGKIIGTVVSVQNHGAGDLLEVQLEGAPHSELVPFQDAFVPEVDLAGGRLMIILPAGDKT